MTEYPAAKREGRMKSAMARLLEGMVLAPALPSEQVHAALGEVADLLPSDYLECLARCNGGEGFLGEGGYLALWPVEQVLQASRDVETGSLAPGLLLFGTNGGGEAYAFDCRDRPPGIVRVPMVGLALEEARPVARTFPEFLARLREGGDL